MILIVLLILIYFFGIKRKKIKTNLHYLEKKYSLYLETKLIL